ncbi:hypothetical protein PR048_004312 [Dryococelus australis]|uniref:Carboxypeptidase n=1 Tax=Dryococelus australis TaxID=614101 RepID=A0ABQ9I681_9NEOP|nr:hypothetical protein PR048_004312 [Dryococelus australis]
MTPRAATALLLLVQIFLVADASLDNSTDAVGSLEDSADEYNRIDSDEDAAEPAPDDDEPRTPTEDPGTRHDDDDDVGERLLLTPLLEAGHLDEARQLSRVKGAPFPDHVESYSGFFTVDPQFDSNLFFWFFPAEKNYEEAPVIVWLQGGPGQPSLIGIFMEIGPFSVAPDNVSLQDNPYSWHKNYSLLFIDNPVGTGFSYTNNQSGYATNQAEIADGLYTAVLQFFTLFPELQENPLYVAGESYGGKHAISLAHFIHNRNPSANITINLKGLFIVSGFFDPVSCLHYSEFLYQVGLLDFNEKKAVKIMEQKGRELIRQGNYKQALHVSNSVHVQCNSINSPHVI